MDSTHPSQSEISPTRGRHRVAVAACFGTFLEWYDFLTFAALAVWFGPLFFPPDDPTAGLLASLATFGAGMIVRPLGAALFGSLGDRIGRRKVFMITIALMGAATLAVGLLPTYAQAGLWASGMLLTLRLLQGLSAGGEIGGSAVYLTEHAPIRSRGLTTSVLQLMGPLGILASTLQIAFLQRNLSPEDFLAWGWRVPFWVSIILLLISIRARMALHETPIFHQLQAQAQLSRTPLRDCFRDRQTLARMGILFLCISAGGGILFFSAQVYSGVFLKTVAGVTGADSSLLVAIGTATLFPLTLFAGWLSDRIGRRPVVLTGLALGCLSIYPVFAEWLLLSNQGPEKAFWPSAALMMMITVPLALVTGPQTALLAELFPARTRYSAAALPHNLAAGWVGGLLPFVIALINDRSGDPLAGLWYPTVMLGLALIVALRWLPETRGCDLSR
jgi:MFS family permease